MYIVNIDLFLKSDVIWNLLEWLYIHSYSIKTSVDFYMYINVSKLITLWDMHFGPRELLLWAKDRHVSVSEDPKLQNNKQI